MIIKQKIKFLTIVTFSLSLFISCEKTDLESLAEENTITSEIIKPINKSYADRTISFFSCSKRNRFYCNPNSIPMEIIVDRPESGQVSFRFTLKVTRESRSKNLKTYTYFSDWIVLDGYPFSHPITIPFTLNDLHTDAIYVNPHKPIRQIKLSKVEFKMNGEDEACLGPGLALCSVHVQQDPHYSIKGRCELKENDINYGQCLNIDTPEVTFNNLNSGAITFKWWDEL